MVGVDGDNPVGCAQVGKLGWGAGLGTKGPSGLGWVGLGSQVATSGGSNEARSQLVRPGAQAGVAEAPWKDQA